MIRYLLAPARAAVVVLVTMTGLVTAAVTALLFVLVVTFPLLVVVVRRFATVGRWLARTWCGVAIAAPYAPSPPAPRPRADGWYEHGNQLFRSPWWPTLAARLEALGRDPANARDWLWLALTPFGGGLLAALPPVLVGAGVWGMTEGRWLAGGLALVGFAVGPLCLRGYGRWSRLLLCPVERTWWRTSGLGPWLGRTNLATWRGAGLAALGLAALALAVVQVVALVVSFGGLFPYVTAAVTRPFLDHYRRTAARWTGQPYPEPYLPLPEEPRPDEAGRYRAGRTLYTTREAAVRAQRHLWILRDPQTWRDLLWTVANVPLGVAGLVPATLAAAGFYGLAGQPVSWLFWGPAVGLATGHWVTPWYMWQALGLAWPAATALPDWVSLPVGLAIGSVSLLLGRPLLALRARFDRRLLAPTRASTLAHRVRQLTQTRADVVDAQAAELRRIERDLHDGAQARLVAVGLGLATVEHLLETDPPAARAMLAQARSTSEAALAELRRLVRGIHPPVLAERGLGDAVRAVALDTPLPVEVAVDLPDRLPAPVESAAYFAVVEALANAARHAHATSVAVVIRHADGMLQVRVADDGRGGADPTAGTGLAGLRRRLATFDGVLRIDSPPGGPTVLTMEIPCVVASQVAPPRQDT